MSRSSRRDPRTYVWDAIEAATHASDFLAGRTRNDYAGDVLLRSGVERRLSIVGEALDQLSHVDDDIVWQVATGKLPPLAEVLRALLAELDG